MTFHQLRTRLLAHLRNRIRNGEWTERGLARRAGISQPHLHNVLKGDRELSPEHADRLLAATKMSILDLFDIAEAEEIRRRAGLNVIQRLLLDKDRLLGEPSHPS